MRVLEGVSNIWNGNGIVQKWLLTPCCKHMGYNGWPAAEPVVGSSRNSTRGSVSSSAAMLTRRRSPRQAAGVGVANEVVCHLQKRGWSSSIGRGALACLQKPTFMLITAAHVGL